MISIAASHMALEGTSMKYSVVVKSIVYSAIMSALLLMVQVVLAGFANIELVSLLVMLFTLYDKKLVRPAIAVFVLLQGILYGFHIWWICYCYVWYLLHFITLATKRYAAPLFSALLCGAFGLAFGSLCAIPYFFIGGFGGGIAYIIAGVPYDIVHCIGNFGLTLVLFTPLQRILGRLPHPAQPNRQAPLS